MNMLARLKTKDDVVTDKDRIGGSYLLNNGLYELTIEHAYFSESEKKALALNVKFVTDEGQQIRSQFWMTSNEEKGGKNTYTGKDKKEHYLPGFNMANHLSILTTEKEIGEQDIETKILNVYNTDAGAEAPTPCECVMDMVGQKVWAGVQRQVVDKTSKESGYMPTGETREINEIDKFFHIDTKQTVTEAMADQEPVFFETWKKEFEGKDPIIKAKGAGVAGAPVKGGAPGTAGKPASGKMFGKKA